MLDVSCLYREDDDSVVLRALLQIIAEFESDAKVS